MIHRFLCLFDLQKSVSSHLLPYLIKTHKNKHPCFWIPIQCCPLKNFDFGSKPLLYFGVETPFNLGWSYNVTINGCHCLWDGWATAHRGLRSEMSSTRNPLSPSADSWLLLGRSRWTLIFERTNITSFS